jgi:hypothetical protein
MKEEEVSFLTRILFRAWAPSGVRRCSNLPCVRFRSGGLKEAVQSNRTWLSSAPRNSYPHLTPIPIPIPTNCREPSASAVRLLHLPIDGLRSGHHIPAPPTTSSPGAGLPVPARHQDIQHLHDPPSAAAPLCSTNSACRRGSSLAYLGLPRRPESSSRLNSWLREPAQFLWACQLGSRR